MRSTEILRQEHNAVLAVLDLLQPAVAAAARGRPVPKDIFSDIAEFFVLFVESCHNGKEESHVFRHLEASGVADPLTQQFSDEHASGKRLGAAFAAATEAYVPGEVATVAPLAEAAHAYDTLLRQHIAEENTALLPMMEASLTDDDAQIADAFDRWEIEVMGTGTHERLHAMIDSLPERITPWLTTGAGRA